MHRHALILLTAVLLSLVAHGARVEATELLQDRVALGDRVELGAEDLRQITSQVLARNPLLSSSPGITAASAQRSVRSTDIAIVIFYPHTQSAGFKQAYQVSCSRQEPDDSWNCNDAEIRRYVSLDSQDFEVRVRGPLGSTEVLALIEATRAALPAVGSEGSVAANTAIMIMPYHETYLVHWGSVEGYARVTMQANLTEDGDPAQPLDWDARIYSPSDD